MGKTNLRYNQDSIDIITKRMPMPTCGKCGQYVVFHVADQVGACWLQINPEFVAGSATYTPWTLMDNGHG